MRGRDVNLAYVSPLPPLRTGVADYSATLLPHLRPHFERIVAVVDGYVPVIADGLVDEVVDGSRRRDWWGDGQAIPLYHMGCNTRYHGYVYDALRRVPGVTVLHDGNLLPLVHELTVQALDRLRDLVRRHVVLAQASLGHQAVAPQFPQLWVHGT